MGVMASQIGRLIVCPTAYKYQQRKIAPHLLSLMRENHWRPMNFPRKGPVHYDDVIMGTIASQITSLTIVYSALYSGADQSKHQSSASLAFVWRIHRGPVNSPHKWPVTRKMSPFDDVIMNLVITLHVMTPSCDGVSSTPDRRQFDARTALPWLNDIWSLKCFILNFIFIYVYMISQFGT